MTTSPPYDREGSELDPQLRALIDQMPMLAASPRRDSSAAAIRAAITAQRRPGVVGPPLALVEDRFIPSSDNERKIPVRLYRPDGDRPLPLAIYFHGGGWSIGDLDMSDTACRITARDSACAVLSVDYRLAPEHPFPAAFDDALAAIRWASAHAADLGADPTRIALIGDSAGANLTAAAAIAMRDAGEGGVIDFQLLYYPCLDLGLTAASIQRHATAPMLTAEALAWSVGNYLGAATSAHDPRVSPLLASDLAGLPAAMIQVAGIDPLQDDGIAYAERLRQAGVSVELLRFESLPHGYLRFALQVEAAGAALHRGTQALRVALHRAEP